MACSPFSATFLTEMVTWSRHDLIYIGYLPRYWLSGSIGYQWLWDWSIEPNYSITFYVSNADYVMLWWLVRENIILMWQQVFTCVFNSWMFYQAPCLLDPKKNDLASISTWYTGASNLMDQYSVSANTWKPKSVRSVLRLKNVKLCIPP